jgi:RNA polymerase sigma-70 factor (ECF subfamily)
MNKGLTKEQFNSMLKKIGKGNKYALEQFYNRYGKMIYIAAYAVCKSDFLADEVVNDVLLKVWKLSAENIEVDNPDGWLYVLAVNATKDRMKNKVISKELPLKEDIIAEKDDFEDILAMNSFFSFIEDLTEEEKEILIYRFVQEQTLDRIAQEKGAPLATIASKYYRAIAKVKEKILKN